MDGAGGGSTSLPADAIADATELYEQMMNTGKLERSEKSKARKNRTLLIHWFATDNMSQDQLDNRNVETIQEDLVSFMKDTKWEGVSEDMADTACDLATIIKAVFHGLPDHKPASTSESVVMRAELQALEQRLTQQWAALWHQTKSRARSCHTATYEEVCESVVNDRERRLKIRWLDQDSWPPPVPSGMSVPNIHPHFGINLAGPENSNVIPKVMEMIGSLPTAVQVPGGMHLGRHPRPAATVNGVRFVDTHNYSYLGPNKLSPAISMMVDGYDVQTFSVLGVLEVQLPPIEPEHRGKMFQHLADLLDENQARKIARGLLYACHKMVFYQAERTEAGVVYTEYPAFDMSGSKELGWQMFCNFCLGGVATYAWQPPTFTVSPRVAGDQVVTLTASGHLGSSRGVEVWEATWEGHAAVCKQYVGPGTSHRLGIEVEALEDIKAQQAGPGIFPELLASDIAQHFILTRPVILFQGFFLTQSRLNQLCDGYAWLHTEVKRVHRDLEPRHVGLTADGLLCVCDMNTSVKRDTLPARPGYAGTLVYASDDVLEAIESGKGAQLPAWPQQDLVPLVKVVYALVHPSARAELDVLAEEVAALSVDAEKVSKVRSFWQQEFDASTPAGQAWQELVVLAHVDKPGTGRSYNDTMQELKLGMAKLLRARA